MFKFNFDDKIFNLDYCAQYFIKSRNIVKDNDNKIVTMQWFQRKNNVVLCGIDYIISLLKKMNIKCSILYLEDGSIINDKEVVLKITGKYSDICHWEGLFDSVLARCSTIATNARNISAVANNKKIINMGDRGDAFVNHQLDGYASYVGGIKTLVTKAQYEFIDPNIKVAGTMPHSLIAYYNGDILEAAKAFKENYPEDDLVCLVDYNNDCITDTLRLADYFKDELKSVRIDTSISLIDKSLQNSDEKDINGVNPHLIKKLRKELDDKGYNHVKIIVSSGFDREKIEYFEKSNAPVDIYGVGEALFNKVTSFTGDLVNVDGKQQSKFGRSEEFNEKLKEIIIGDIE